MNKRSLVVMVTFLGLVLSACRRSDESSTALGPSAAPPAGTVTTWSSSSASSDAGSSSTAAGSSSSGGSSSSASSAPSGSRGLTIYSDELRQGGAFLYPSGENQTLAFDDRSNMISGN